jgi:hypothetical protein
MQSPYLDELGKHWHFGKALAALHLELRLAGD